jgi:hypothetical protein
MYRVVPKRASIAVNMHLAEETLFYHNKKIEKASYPQINCLLPMVGVQQKRMTFWFFFECLNV